jgi:hypothetical protein
MRRLLLRLMCSHAPLFVFYSFLFYFYHASQISLIPALCLRADDLRAAARVNSKTVRAGGALGELRREWAGLLAAGQVSVANRGTGDRGHGSTLALGRAAMLANSEADGRWTTPSIEQFGLGQTVSAPGRASRLLFFLKLYRSDLPRISGEEHNVHSRRLRW